MRSRSKSWLCATLLGRSMRVSVPIVLAAVLLLTAASIPAQATPPKTPYDLLEERAAKEGAAAVRGNYRKDVNAILASLKQPPESPSLKESFQRTLTVSWLFQYLHSWASVEARDIRLQKASPEEMTGSVVVSILDIVEVAMGLGTEELQRMERLRAKAPPGELKGLGLTESLEPSVAINRNALLYQLALLAKLAGAREQLERVFRLSPTKIGSFGSVKDFLAYPHDYDSLLEIPKVKQRKESEPGPLAEDEKESIRQLVESFWQAIVRQDAAELTRLYLEPTAAHSLSARMAEAKLVSFDLSQAKFQFTRPQPDLVRVRVDNVSAVRMKNGQRTTTVSGKTFLVALRDGHALIVAVGGAS